MHQAIRNQGSVLHRPKATASQSDSAIAASKSNSSGRGLTYTSLFKKRDLFRQKSITTAPTVIAGEIVPEGTSYFSPSATSDLRTPAPVATLSSLRRQDTSSSTEGTFSAYSPQVQSGRIGVPAPLPAPAHVPSMRPWTHSPRSSTSSAQTSQASFRWSVGSASTLSSAEVHSSRLAGCAADPPTGEGKNVAKAGQQHVADTSENAYKFPLDRPVKVDEITATLQIALQLESLPASREISPDDHAPHAPGRAVVIKGTESFRKGHGQSDSIESMTSVFSDLSEDNVSWSKFPTPPSMSRQASVSSHVNSQLSTGYDRKLDSCQRSAAVQDNLAESKRPSALANPDNLSNCSARSAAGTNMARNLGLTLHTGAPLRRRQPTPVTS